MVEENERNTSTLVIIGCSVAGTYLLRKLIANKGWLKFRIIVIDKNDYIEWFVNIQNYLCNEQTVDRHVLSINEYFTKNNLSQYNMEFVQGTVTNVTTDNEQTGGIVEYHDAQGKNSQPYHVLVVATGVQYGDPIKSEAIGRDDRLQEVKSWSDRLKESKDIVVVGGGAVGVELAGAFAYQFKDQPDKAIHLVTRSKELMGRLPSEARTYALQALQKLKVNVHFQKDSNELRQTLPEALFVPGPTTINTNFLRNSSFEGALEVNGAIKVNRYLQVQGHKNIFALGDCCKTLLNEEKCVISINQLGKTVVENVERIMMGRSLMQIPTRLQFVQAVPIGEEDGIIVLNRKIVKTGKGISAEKKKLVDHFGKLDEELSHEKKLESIFRFLGCISAMCCCFPFSSRYEK